MVSNKRSLTEQVRRILSGGYPSDNDRVQDGEIRLHLNAAIGKALKAEALATTWNLEGESIPDGSLLATYENVPVIRGYGGTAKAKLPVTPMYLPERMGVFSVFPSGRPRQEYIPIPAGMINIWQGEALLNPINRRLYSWDSGYVTVYDDLVGAGILTLDMKLAVVDLDSLGDYDPLPISTDMEGQVIAEVLQLLGVVLRTERDDDKKASPAKGE